MNFTKCVVLVCLFGVVLCESSHTITEDEVDDFVSADIHGKWVGDVDKKLAEPYVSVVLYYHPDELGEYWLYVILCSTVYYYRTIYCINNWINFKHGDNLKKQKQRAISFTI